MIRTRFAPSPTGYLHIGGLRTALYAYLFARKNNGKFILRIEDTDQERRVEGALENLIHTLHWHGLEYDEGPMPDGSQKGEHGPYIQSERTEIYREHVQTLLKNGAAYHCFCTRERLDEMRERQIANKQATMYDRHCCDLPESEIAAKLASNTPYVIRLKVPYETLKFKDLIRGNVQFHGKTIDDQVLMKSDGFPTYHLANVIDDHLMKITHVIRGEEWLPSTPKHIALYHAFGWEPPEFAHLPLMLNADKTKLSKRQGDVSAEDYIKKGYLKEAIINFIVFLGWNPGSAEEREIFTLQELEEAFSLEKVHKAGAVFNLEKLDWFNWRWKKEKHLQKLQLIAEEIDPQVEITEPRRGQFSYKFSTNTQEEQFSEKRGEIILKEVEDIIEPDYKKDPTKLTKALIVSEEKILKEKDETNATLKSFYNLEEYDQELLTHEKMQVDLVQAKSSLIASIETLEAISDWRLEVITEALLTKVTTLDIKNGQLLWPLRAALSGQQFSPGAFELAWVLGKDQSIERINLAINKIK